VPRWPQLARAASVPLTVSQAKQRAPVVLLPGAGREYPMGPLCAVFKADGDETQCRYSISEWWLDPYTRGPGTHSHEEDDVFFVLEGTMSFFIGGEWLDAPKGSLVIAPGGTPHDFENRTAQRAGALNLSVPGDFESEMEGIAEWFRARSAADSRTANAPHTERASPDERARKRND
jgi:mannose-6-phosphate isomerase-like protein (cupin superfamily)